MLFSFATVNRNESSCPLRPDINSVFWDGIIRESTHHSIQTQPQPSATAYKMTNICDYEDRIMKHSWLLASVLVEIILFRFSLRSWKYIFIHTHSKRKGKPISNMWNYMQINKSFECFQFRQNIKLFLRDWKLNGPQNSEWGWKRKGLFKFNLIYNQWAYRMR